jgi:opacity protein-like surface antigen
LSVPRFLPPAAGILSVALMLAATWSAARAADGDDDYQPRRRGSHGTRNYNGWGFLYAKPQREFKDLAGNGYGLQAQGSAALDSRGIIRAHSDISLLYHVNHDEDVPSSQLTPGDRLTLGTTASMFHILIGPELSMPSGRQRFYIFGTAGFATTWARQQISGNVAAGTQSYDLQTSKQSNMFAWSAGGGVRIQRMPGVWMDLSAELRQALEGRMITKDLVGTSGPVVTYGQGSVDMTQLVFRFAVSRSARE